jgi:hypothetical protein
MDSQIANWRQMLENGAFSCFSFKNTRMAEERGLSFICRGRKEVVVGLARIAGERGAVEGEREERR